MTIRCTLPACIILVAVAALPAPAVAAPIQPGLWELAMTVTADGKVDTVPAGRACLTPQDIEHPTRALPRPGGACTLSNVQRTADRATYDLTCAENQVNSRGRADITFGGDRYDGKVEMMLIGKSGGGMPVAMAISARRVGDCPP
jgi:hypothetical protein